MKLGSTQVFKSYFAFKSAREIESTFNSHCTNCFFFFTKYDRILTSSMMIGL